MFARRYLSLLAFCFFAAPCVLLAQTAGAPPALLPNNDTMLLTVFLKHDQSMNNIQRRELLDDAGFNDKFPPAGVEIVDRYVMMGIGQVIILRLPPNRLRLVNLAIEQSAWGAYQTEFYVTYDLREARAAQDLATAKINEDKQ